MLVDNGCTSNALKRLTGRPRVTILDPGENIGFAGGSNHGATRATGQHLAFVNGDAVVKPDALRRLVDELGDDIGLTTASLRVYGDEDVINSAGNPVHYLGLSWAGGLGQPARATVNSPTSRPHPGLRQPADVTGSRS